MSITTVIASMSASSTPGATSTPYVSRTRNQRIETVATGAPPCSIRYSWLTMLPLAVRSAPPGTSICQRSRNGVSNALCTLAAAEPSGLSMVIESRTRTTFSWILYSSPPRASSKRSVDRSRRALPSTLKTRSFRSLVMKKSSPIENIRCRIW